IIELLNIAMLFPHIQIIDIDRGLFAGAFVSVADVVLFTGRYVNAKIVEGYGSEGLFIYTGGGVNPVLVTETANISLAAEKIIDARVFNSGQDCHAPDVIFVHDKVINNFQEALFTDLDKIKIGNYEDHEVRVGRLIELNQVSIIRNFFSVHSKSIIYGGKIL